MEEVTGRYTTIKGEDFFVIENYDQMRPFFMTVVSANDHWLFISSNGGLSAGRQNPEKALFPYYTDDKITDSAGITGNKTILKVKISDTTHLWEPFSEYYRGIYQLKANLYKNREGNKIIFEECNHDLGICFRYGWMFSEKYGIIKQTSVTNLEKESVSIELVDGIQNILPSGVNSNLQNIRSTLVDAYKRSELETETGLAIYSLSSMIVDRAEPSEALKATTVWCAGIDYQKILLSSLQLKSFVGGKSLEDELDIKAEKGAFFVQTTIELKAESEQSWIIVGEVDQTATTIASLRKSLLNREKLYQNVIADIAKNKQDLREKIGLSDGIQLSNDRLSTGRHFSNVLFNIMRGGTFYDIYQIETADFLAHIKQMNKLAYGRLKAVLSALPKYISYHQLRHFMSTTSQTSAFRYYLEYLPLSFSRRHGDPSRPWNYFSIETKDDHGNKLRHFEGNWRDIFQNWEALAYSYPEYSLGMIAKFVNASTIDGYNPYRITREGIDWEVIEPDDPWSYIGYWGDHQVIYLTKFIEISHAYHPHRLKELLTKKIFTYANVPYKIRGYDAIVNNPKSTIDFDHVLEGKVQEKVQKVGSDGKLVWDKNDQLLRVNLTEKLLVMILTKLYNFIPEAGIWLNTQRPEWNDANNALVGNGVSMVTLYYLKRHLSFIRKVLLDVMPLEIEVNKPVIDLLQALKRGFNQFHHVLQRNFTDEERRQFMDDFGIAGEHYRTTAYAGFTGDKRSISIKEMLDFFSLTEEFLDHSINCNQREDKLYHSYNLITLSENEASVKHLYEMLEGQVAAISTLCLSPNEILEILDALRASSMFRADQYSYMLYPDRELASYLDKNSIDKSLLKSSSLADQLLLHNDTSIIEKDVNGELHFNGNFHNSNDLESALSHIENPEWKKLAKKEKHIFLNAFEKVFNHHAFTGRSGAFYGYEGLGSIYWHMVSKLLLAIQENIQIASENKAPKDILGRLIEHYYEIRAGIGVNKSPSLYGAFPTDAYSHTPKYAGAKQPGMTGQVKEDIINRWAELGIKVEKGLLSFEPYLLRREEFIEKEATLSYYDHNGMASKIQVPDRAMAFTYCQIPIIYQLASSKGIQISYSDETVLDSKSRSLSVEDSKNVFKRNGTIKFLIVSIIENELI